MGCNGSKAPKATVGGSAAPAAEPAAAAPAADLLTTAPAEPKPEQVAAVEAAEAAPAPTSLKLAIASAHGLRPADVLTNKSDVCVEVMIEGKPDSKVTTSVVAAPAAARPGAEAGAKPCVDVELKFDGELKGYVAGDKVVFTVKDKDLLTSDILGKATVSDGQFGGKLVLEGAGEGYEAFLLVQLGEGNGVASAMQALAEAAEAAKQKIAEALGLAATGEPAKEDVKEALAEPAVIKEEAAQVAVVLEGMAESKNASCACF